MSEMSRDIHIIEHIIDYCEQIFEAVDRFGNEERILNGRTGYIIIGCF